MSDERIPRPNGMTRGPVRGPGDDRPESIHTLLTITHVVYALHAFAIVSGVIGSVAVLLSFLASIPSIIAVILNYLKRDAVRGTWLESHFSWQIRTFWFALLWVVVATVLILTVVGALIGFPMLLVVTVWVIYRVTRGWWVLLHGRTLPMRAIA